jgi:DNA invertase Pin-like site-specific DNA recombinase
VALQVLDHAINTNDAAGRLLFNMLGAIGQFETELRAERQRDGIAAARARGVHLGRQPTLSPTAVADVRARRANGETIKTLMEAYGVSKATIYRALAHEHA